jgi:Set1/Ash2 histone methyltransferase complex subunit ASH2
VSLCEIISTIYLNNFTPFAETHAAAVVENRAKTVAAPESETAVRCPIPADGAKEAPALAGYEPAPPNRSKKRKAAARPAAQEEMIRLGDPVERKSERLSREKRHVKLSVEGKAPQIVLDDSQLTASSSKGYCTVRCTHGAHSGTWYYEVTIEQLGQTGAVRLGWSTRESEIQAPVGSDGLGYAYRSVQGSRVHEGVREEYGKQYGEGDIVGCLLHMPPGGRTLEKTAEGEKEKKEENSC